MVGGHLLDAGECADLEESDQVGGADRRGHVGEQHLRGLCRRRECGKGRQDEGDRPAAAVTDEALISARRFLISLSIAAIVAPVITSATTMPTDSSSRIPFSRLWVIAMKSASRRS